MVTKSMVSASTTGAGPRRRHPCRAAGRGEGCAGLTIADYIISLQAYVALLDGATRNGIKGR